MRSYGTYRICVQRRLGRACASVENCQPLTANCPHTHRKSVDEGTLLSLG